MARDYYEVLGVARDADEGQIKKAFRRLARELHPDTNQDDPSAEGRFKEAASAYEVLLDPERRALYDRYGEDGLRNGGGAPSFDGFGLADIFQSFFGPGGFDAFGGGGRTRSGPRQGGDVAATVEIDLAEAARGTRTTVAYEVVSRCETCHGNGAEPGTPIVTCPRCGGTGQLQVVQRTAFGQMVRAAACDRCGGDGRLAEQPCHTCEGRGRVLDEREVEIDVPAGIADGQRIRVSGRGHAGERGGPPGDLYVLVGVREDARFLRDGDDLVSVVDLPAPLAALGTSVEVPTLDAPEPLEIPAGTQPGATLVLRGRGMPRLGRGRPGDLRVVVNVVVPRRLSREQRELYERLVAMGGEDGAEEEGLLGKLRRVLAG